MSFINRENAIKAIDDYAQDLYSHNDWKMGETADYCSTLVESLPEEYVVRIEEWNKLNFDCNVLKALLNGEWVKCDDAMEALNITFDQGLKMFQFGTNGPLNKDSERAGSFRISEKTLAQAKMKDFEGDFKLQEAIVRSRSNPDTHQWELILEQQGGII